MFRKLLSHCGLRNPARPLKVFSVVKNGFIRPPSHLELILTDQCNLACRACNHFAPIMPRWMANAESVKRDCTILAKVYRPRKIKIIGGEPLLHKGFPAIVTAARSTAICDYFSLVTNGVFLNRMTDAHWDVIDEIELSCYPGFTPPPEALSNLKSDCERRGKTLVIAEFQEFRETLSLVGTNDDELTAKLYQACKIANVWGAHAFRDGYFYKCPQSTMLEALQRETGCTLAETDRIAIEDIPGLQANLLNFINSSIPLRCCRNCTGTCGKLIPHENLAKTAWMQDVERPLEEMVDFPWLERSLREAICVDDCVAIKVNGKEFQPATR